MLHSNAARATRAVAQRSPRIDQLGSTINSTHTTQPNLSATLIGSDRCEADGIVATGYAPVLAMCRKLLQAGINPDAALIVYRRGIVALRVRSIGDGARLTVKTAGNGAPIFALEGGGKGATASPMRNAKLGGR